MTATDMELCRFRHLKHLIEWLKTDAGRYFRDEMERIGRTGVLAGGYTPRGFIPYQVLKEAFSEASK